MPAIAVAIARNASASPLLCGLDRIEHMQSPHPKRLQQRVFMRISKSWLIIWRGGGNDIGRAATRHLPSKPGSSGMSLDRLSRGQPQGDGSSASGGRWCRRRAARGSIVDFFHTIRECHIAARLRAQSTHRDWL